MPAGAHYREAGPLSPCLRDCSAIIQWPPKEWEGNGAETPRLASLCRLFDPRRATRVRVGEGSATIRPQPRKSAHRLAR